MKHRQPAEMSGLDGLIAGYLELLGRYHRTLDLMSSQALAGVERLVVDAKAYAATVATHAPSDATIVDVGSGAGLPGIVVALTLPDTDVILVERRRRRAAFLDLVAGRLSIANVKVVNQDVRRISGLCADVVTAQAVARLDEVARLTRHLHADTCLLVSRRGPGWEQELPALRDMIAGERAASAGSATERDERTEHPAEPAANRTANRDAQEGAAEAADGAAVAVLSAEPLEQRGSLVALRLAGGPACRSSG